MKRSDELKQKRTGLLKEIEPLSTKADLTAEEQKSFDEKTTEIDELTRKIETAEKQERIAALSAAANGQTINKEDGEARELGQYNFARAMRVAIGEEKGGFEEEMNQEGKNELQGLGKTARGFVIPTSVLSRASTGQNVTTPADGGYLVQDSPLKFYESLKDALVLTQLGATMLTGLKGDVPLVTGGTFTAAFVAEDADVTPTKEAYTKATLSGKRLAIAGALSKKLIMQASPDAQQLVQNGLLNAMARGIQNAAINGSGSGANPTGILNTAGIGSVAMGTDGGALDWQSIVDLEKEIAIDNALMGNLSYLTNAKVTSKMKTTLRAAGISGYLMDGGMSNGYKVGVTNAVPSNLVKGGSGAVCSALILGAWDKLLIGLFGGMDIVTDPYSYAGKNELAIWINQYADVALENAAYFAAIKDITTA